MNSGHLIVETNTPILSKYCVLVSHEGHLCFADREVARRYITDSRNYFLEIRELDYVLSRSLYSSAPSNVLYLRDDYLESPITMIMWEAYEVYHPEVLARATQELQQVYRKVYKDAFLHSYL